MKTDNQIELRSITELLGLNFYIPDYQRGYRWTYQNVTQLLEDVWEYRNEKSNANTFYCLQPIVVRKKGWKDATGRTVEGYELIDGQQRMTTIYRILSYLILNVFPHDRFKKKYEKGLYSLYYKTRPETQAFLEEQQYNDTKPDLYYLSEAYKTIEKWFEDETNEIGFEGLLKFFTTILPDVKSPKVPGSFPEWSVQVIWYEIKDNSQKSEELFTRLNRGKIPLTSAELIKAKFVNENSFSGLSSDDRIKRRTQLIQIWDEIENQLNNPKFWAFVSNQPFETYSNKIEYLFDVSTGKKRNETDKLYSFIHFFDKVETAETLWKKWIDIEEIYRSLLFWSGDKNLYHKIGYLINSGIKIKDLIKIKKKQTKKKFEIKIDELIAAKIPDNWQDLSYGSDNSKIIDTLLFINIELTRTNRNENDFFPFEAYKQIGKSLEHIHAQNIEGIDKSKQEQWMNWLHSHIHILPQISNDKGKAEKLAKEVQEIDLKKFRYPHFEDLSKKILTLIPKEAIEETEYLNKIQNLALLGIKENIKLSNSIFEIKRRKIIEMDKEGEFIPLSTRRVFLNYYNGESFGSHSMWTKIQRDNYLVEMEKCLRPYLTLKTNKDEA
jgi:hypothetical protein